MRGTDTKQATMLSLVTPEQRVPQNHPLRAVKKLADAALAELSPTFNEMYSAVGRMSDDHFTVDGTLIERRAPPNATPRSR